MRRRLRSTIKWSGAVATVLLLVVWVGSRWWACSIGIPHAGNVNMGGGSLTFQGTNSASLRPNAFSWSGPHRNIMAFEWWFHYHRLSRAGETITLVFIPVWALVVLTAVPTAWLWCRDRRRAPGLCIKCGYDLRGTDHKVCPECGAPSVRGEAPRELKVES